MNKINLSAYHPILDIQDHIIVFANNGNVVLCYKGNLPEIYSLSEKDFEDIHGAWFQAFKSLPVSTVIHKQDVYQKEHNIHASEAYLMTSFLEKATHTYFKGPRTIWNIVVIYSLYCLKNKALNASKFTNPFRKVEKGIHKKLDHTKLQEFITSVNDAISFINNSRKVKFIRLWKI